MDLAVLSTFALVVELRSFSAAARRLDVSPAAVGKQIAHLEKWLGARLFDRTTRRLRLTEAGRQFHERSTRILQEMADAQRAAAASQIEPRGLLTISAPVSFAALHLGRALARFMAAHEQLSVDMQLDDRKLNLIEAGFDCALRIGPVRETNVIARRIGSSPFILCAAPSYVRAHSTLQHPRQLLEHDCLLYTLGPAQWRFTSTAGEEESIQVSGRLRTNNGLVLAAAAIEGYGVTYAPAFVVGGALRTKQLIQLLSNYATVSSPIHIVYPAGRHVPMKVRRFAEFMKKLNTKEWGGT
jgi:DNA-binding transcriptional LysR family regulator